MTAHDKIRSEILPRYYATHGEKFFPTIAVFSDLSETVESEGRVLNTVVRLTSRISVVDLLLVFQLAFCGQWKDAPRLFLACAHFLPLRRHSGSLINRVYMVMLHANDEK